MLAEIAAAARLRRAQPARPGLRLGTGAGDVVEPLRAAGAPRARAAAAPFVLSTADVYREADRLRLRRASADLHACRKERADTLQPGARLPDRLLINDLAPAARSLCPAIDDALRDAGAAGADNTIVCGSGPTVAGLFWGERAPERAAAAAQQLVDRSYPDRGPATPSGCGVWNAGTRLTTAFGTICTFHDEQPGDHISRRSVSRRFRSRGILRARRRSRDQLLQATARARAVVVLSLYVLAALIGVGVLAGALIVVEWPRVF